MGKKRLLQITSVFKKGFRESLGQLVQGRRELLSGAAMTLR